MKTKLLIFVCAFLSLSAFSQINVVTQNITVQLNGSGETSITSGQIDNGSSASDGIAQLLLDTTSFDCSNVGTNLVTLTVVSTSGASESASATVTVEDTMLPVISSKSLKLTLDANGEAVATAQMVDTGSTDNCGIASLSLEQTLFTCADIGKNKVNYTVTDVNGNISTKLISITVKGNVTPTVITQNITVEIGAGGIATITPDMIDNGSSAPCGIASLSLSKTTFTCADLSGIQVRSSLASLNKSANKTVELTVTDNNGNTSTGIATVTVQDTTGPEFTTIESYIVYLNNSGNGSFLTSNFDASTIQDYCGVKSISYGNTAFTCADIGFTTITVTAEDNNDNFSTGIINIEVRDINAPKVSTKNITVELGVNGEVLITPSMVNSKTKDNCSYTLSLDNSLFTCADLGDNIVNLTATDLGGNTSSKTATVTVIDTIPLIISAKNIVVELDASGSATISPSMIDDGTSDNCAFTLSLDKEIFNCNDIGDNTVSLIATDYNGDTFTATSTVTVVDIVAPAITGQDISVTLTANGTVGIVWNDVLNNGSDNCTAVTYTISDDTFDAQDIPNNPVLIQLVGTDAYGNTSSVPVNVTVVDPMPTVVTQDITVNLDANGGVTITASQIDNGSNSVVGLSGLSLDTASFDCSNVGANTVTLTATSTLGSSASATSTVTVVDSVAPVIVGQDITVMLTPSGTVSIVANDVLSSGSDNCTGVTYTISESIFDGQDVLNSPVTIQLTGVDAYGNQTVVPINVTVLDASINVITQDIAVSLDENGNATITTGQIDNGSNSPVGIDSLSLDTTSFDC